MATDRAAQEAAMSDEALAELIREEERREFDAMRSHRGVRAAGLLFRALSRVAPPLAFRAIYRMARTPRRFRPHPREEELLATATPLEFETSFGKIAAWTWGEGPTVHLVHGWQGRGSQLAELAEPIAALGLRVLVWDGPAHGRSDGKIASAPEFCQAIREVAAIDGQPWAVVAHSMGTIASTLASWGDYHPTRRVYIGTAHEPRKPLRMLNQVFGFSDEIIGRFKSALVAQGTPKITWDVLAAGALPPGMADPLLLIHDRGDREADVATAVAFQKVWPGARLMLTNGLGHNAVLRDPAVVQAGVEFLREGL